MSAAADAAEIPGPALLLDMFEGLTLVPLQGFGGLSPDGEHTPTKLGQGSSGVALERHLDMKSGFSAAMTSAVSVYTFL